MFVALQYQEASNYSILCTFLIALLGCPAAFDSGGRRSFRFPSPRTWLTHSLHISMFFTLCVFFAFLRCFVLYYYVLCNVQIIAFCRIIFPLQMKHLQRNIDLRQHAGLVELLSHKVFCQHIVSQVRNSHQFAEFQVLYLFLCFLLTCSELFCPLMLCFFHCTSITWRFESQRYINKLTHLEVCLFTLFKTTAN